MIKLKSLLLYMTILILKSYDIPSLCYNYYNPESIYQQMFLKPSIVPAVYYFIPRKYFIVISCICDLLVAFMLNSEKYLICSIFFPADAISIENLLIALLKKGYNELPAAILTSMNTFYAPLLSGSNAFVLSYVFPHLFEAEFTNSHRPSLSVTWFFHLNMFSQYARYFYDTFYALMAYMAFTVPEKYKLEIILLFKPSNYKSYLPFIVHSPVLHFYLLFFVLENYIQYLFRIRGVGNPNFINWCCVAFNSLFILERRWKTLKAREHSVRPESAIKSHTKTSITGNSSS
ncbi:8TM microsporidial transmembrane domain-containing protein [Ordospora pajunii]|uniref:8TM microsporidial transmembrane domain-containing protein n=1 Tax=Ordospora pajunii TaxID=3039483 RepID=UPI002952602E|nr:8TM microsporidial transmembrane domain-containing protein [Ordospora pajunii]KAH9412074.1 8TM microsporidial transmembrane domain-containing protein [Ordospora pajunii]